MLMFLCSAVLGGSTQKWTLALLMVPLFRTLWTLRLKEGLGLGFPLECLDLMGLLCLGGPTKRRRKKCLGGRVLPSLPSLTGVEEEPWGGSLRVRVFSVFRVWECYNLTQTSWCFFCCPSGRYESFSRTEDCGILHGCENGQCIRVSEGYTCDCYQGYELDMTSMTCIGENILINFWFCVFTDIKYKYLCWQTLMSARAAWISRVWMLGAWTRKARFVASVCEGSSWLNPTTVWLHKLDQPAGLDQTGLYWLGVWCHTGLDCVGPDWLYIQYSHHFPSSSMYHTGLVSDFEGLNFSGRAASHMRPCNELATY